MSLPALNGDTLGHGGFVGFDPGVRMAQTGACSELDMEHEGILSFCSLGSLRF